MRLLIETDVESGLRWGELTELRVKDLDLATGVVTVSRVVVELTMKKRPEGQRFLVKDYPKDRKWRRLRLAPQLATKLSNHIAGHHLADDDLLFAVSAGPRRYRIPEVLPDPATLGWTEPKDKGRRYRHGTPTAYAMARCRCRHCKDAVAALPASPSSRKGVRLGGSRRARSSGFPRSGQILRAGGGGPGSRSDRGATAPQGAPLTGPAGRGCWRRRGKPGCCGACSCSLSMRTVWSPP
jgi:hypothetical protein